MGDAASVPASGVGKVLGLAALPGTSDPVALAVGAGAGTVFVPVLWPRWRPVARLLPAPSAAIGRAAAVTGAFGLPVRRVKVRGLFDAVQLPSPASAGAADAGRGRRHRPRVRADRVRGVPVQRGGRGPTARRAADGLRQGADRPGRREHGVRGARGAAHDRHGRAERGQCAGRGADQGVAGPSRGVVAAVRRCAARRAGADSGGGARGLAGLVVHAGCELVRVRVRVRESVQLWREHRGETVVLAVTAFAIVATNLFEGVLAGLAPAVAKTAWDISHVQVRTEDRGPGDRRAGRTGGRQRHVSAAAEAARRAGGVACRPGRAAGTGWAAAP